MVYLQSNARSRECGHSGLSGQGGQKRTGYCLWSARLILNV